MDKFKFLLLVVTLFVACLVRAQVGPVAIDTDFRWVSRYTSYGVESFRSPGLQSNVEVTFGQTTLGWWSHADWANGTEPNVQEHDWYVYGTYAAGDWELYPMLIGYEYPNGTWSPTTEIWLSGLKSLKQFDLLVDVAVDIKDNNGGLYLGLNALKSCEGGGYTHDTTLTVGFMNAKNMVYNYGPDKAGMTHLSLDYKLSRPIGGGYTGYVAGTAFYYPTKDVHASDGNLIGILSLGVSASF